VTEKERPKPKEKESRGLLAYLKQRHDPLTGLLLTAPIFLLYHLGILAIDLRNGVDLVSVLTFELLERSLALYVVVTLGYVAAIAVAAYLLRKRGTIKPAELLPVVGESVVLAIIMLFTVGWATQQLFDWQTGPPAMNPFEKIVMAAGAGFHEELVFRVALFAGSALVLRKVARMGDTTSYLIAAVGSALIFSSVHYIGAMSDQFQLQSFVFRFLAGLYLAAIYRFRGFAVAVYTHAIYDVIVFFIR
jgi:membrane protease YdiL (CAAX protease family)